MEIWQKEEKQKLELEEWNVRSLQRIKPGINTLVLRNRSGKDVDELALADGLVRVDGIRRIKSLNVGWDSRVKDLRFLRALPALEILDLHGYRLRSLEGMEWFRRGRYLNVETEKNRSRNIEKMFKAPIARLSLQWANPGDLDAVGRVSTLRELLLSRCPRLPLEHWRGVPLEYLGLWNGAFSELAGTRAIASLRDVTLHGCRKLKRFAGDNSNVRWMTIQACNHLDLRTVATLRNLEHLAVVGSKQEVPFSAFARLGQLRTLSLQQCQVHFDVLELKATARKLEKIVIRPLPRNQVAKLSEANPGVMVWNLRWFYRNGSLVSESPP